MISFDVDSVETAQRVLEKVRVVTFAESLGGTESLITYPMKQSHPECPEGVERKAWHHRHSAAPVRWTGACGRADCGSGAGVCFLRKNPRCRDCIAAEQKNVAFATRCRHKNPAGQDFC